MAENGKGDDITVDTKWTGEIVDSSWFKSPAMEKYRQPGNIKVPFWLQPEKYYTGMAWYQRKIRIPGSWKSKNIRLFLERCHWETHVWVDEQDAGTKNSLGTPHVYDLTSMLSPGTHLLTICVDNRIKDIDVGINSHSIIGSYPDQLERNCGKNGTGSTVARFHKPYFSISRTRESSDQSKNHYSKYR